MAKRGRKYLEAAKKVDRSKFYSVKDAIDLIKETAVTTFDPTVEVHLRMGVDPRKADQMIRDVVVLPHGLGKEVRVLVFAEGEDAELARQAGADFIADDEVIAQIQGGWTDFDVAMAVPAMMGKVGRLGRVLGPRGLMPNPRAGTVAPASALEQLIKEAKAGRVEFRVDRTANIHASIGKASFTATQLTENFRAFMSVVNRNRPASLKGVYLRRVTMANTMGPGIRVDVNDTIE